MGNLKPIETVYNGYRFRSRLEARWAVFFGELGIEYIYEPEGFIFPDGTHYLPDFYLPDMHTFFEVKGIMNDKDMHKINQLLDYSGKHVAIGYADMTFEASDLCEVDENGNPVYQFYGTENSSLCLCNDCNKYYFMGEIGSWECRCCGAYDGDNGFIRVLEGDWADRERSWWMSSEVKSALAKARQARFEHGETPNIIRR